MFIKFKTQERIVRQVCQKLSKRAMRINSLPFCHTHPKLTIAGLKWYILVVCNFYERRRFFLSPRKFVYGISLLVSNLYTKQEHSTSFLFIV